MEACGAFEPWHDKKSHKLCQTPDHSHSIVIYTMFMFKINVMRKFHCSIP